MTQAQLLILIDLLTHQLDVLHEIHWHLCRAPEGCSTPCTCRICERKHKELEKGEGGK